MVQEEAIAAPHNRHSKPPEEPCIMNRTNKVQRAYNTSLVPEVVAL
jgi:hypothetical protein